ncbi:MULTISPECIES: universal stress protein [unclassified Brevibacterium]|uniref:universal stress protein n=1 Tax=unclassified Brevibacterium TaxID=2614124 RepID=UPI000C4C7CF4|nr:MULTISPECIES: universal stress protein [unclassified Brevibacterium]SMX97658.1 Nucleotide-binding universal stress protein, UspA family [Brevibacterium sp. 239c]
MTIVVGYVNNPAGHAALDKGIAEAKKDGQNLVVVNASRSSERSDSYRLGEGEIKSVQDYLSRSGVHGRVLTRGSEYDPAEQILDAAAEVDAELIVLGTRKRTPVGKFLLGSTIQRVILEAVSPVLCVKAGR